MESWPLQNRNSLLRQVVWGLQPARAHNGPMWFSVCTEIANITVAMATKILLWRSVMSPPCHVLPSVTKQGQMPRLLRLCLVIAPQWGFLPLQAPVAPGQSKFAMPIEKWSWLQRFFRKQTHERNRGEAEKFLLARHTQHMQVCNWELYTSRTYKTTASSVHHDDPLLVGFNVASCFLMSLCFGIQ